MNNYGTMNRSTTILLLSNHTKRSTCRKLKINGLKRKEFSVPK